MGIVESMWQTRATLSLEHTFAHVERIKKEKVRMYMEGSGFVSRSHTEFSLFLLTRSTFLNAFLDNSAALASRVTIYFPAIFFGCMNDDFFSFFEESLAEVVMTVAAIFIAIIGIVSPDAAKAVARTFLGQVLVDTKLIAKDSDGGLAHKDEAMDNWIEAQLTKSKDLTFAGLRA